MAFFISMEWEFDKNGFVKPYNWIPITIDEFKEKFTGEREIVIGNAKGEVS